MTAGYWRRLRAYLTGDQGLAEDIDDIPTVADFAWIDQARETNEVAEYAVEAAKRSAEVAESAVASLQSKATNLLTILLTLAPISFAVTGLVLSGSGSVWVQAIGFLLMVLVDLLLVASAGLAFIASGLLLAGGLNLDRMSSGGHAALPSLRASEANAWHLAAQLAMWKGPRVGRDLFHARRLVVIALLVAIVASPFVVLARSGDPANKPEPSPTISSTP